MLLKLEDLPLLVLLSIEVPDGVKQVEDQLLTKHGVVASVPTIKKVFLFVTVVVDLQIKFAGQELVVLPITVVATKTHVPVNQVVLEAIQ
jgi:hypothetical protein